MGVGTEGPGWLRGWAPLARADAQTQPAVPSLPPGTRGHGSASTAPSARSGAGHSPGQAQLRLKAAVPGQPLWAEAPLSCHLSDKSGPGMSPRGPVSLGTAGAGMDAPVILASLVTPGCGHGQGAGAAALGPNDPSLPRSRARGTATARHRLSKVWLSPSPVPRAPEVAVGDRSQPCALS